jgi:autotransporter-associated beta strand protein
MDGGLAGGIGGTLIKQGTGTLILSGVNTYSGGTTVSAGVLQGNAQSLQGAIVNQSAVVFDQAALGTYAGAMSGAGSLAKIGAGTLVLSGANTYRGGTFVSGGTLQGDSRSLQGDILNQAAVVFNETGSGTYAGNIAGSGSLTKQGNGLLVLGGTNSYSGGTTVGAGTLQGNTSSLQGNIANQGSVVFDQAAGGAYNGSMSGAGSLTKQGSGLLVLGGANSYTGGTTIASGALMGDTTSLQGNIVNQGTVAFDQASSGTFAGVMSGSGALVKQGAGLLTLSGLNTYSGGTLVGAGTLAGTTRSLQGDFLNNATLLFDQNDPGVYTGNMAGNGLLTKQGTGSINMTGDFSQFFGSTMIAGGMLSINGWLGGGLTVGAGGMVGGNGIVSSVTLQPGAILAPGMSVGTLHVDGDVTFQSGAIYRVETEAYGAADLTMASGRLFATGGVVDVRAGGTRRYRPINRYAIAATGVGVNGTFATVVSNAGYLNPSLQYDARNVYLTLRRNDVDFRSFGTAGNQTAVASVFNQLVGNATGSFADVVNNVYDQSDAQAQHALGSMSGIQYQHVARSGLDTARMFTGVSLKRLGWASRADGSPMPDSGLAVNNLAAASAGANVGDAQANGGDVTRGWWLSGLGGLASHRGRAGDAGAQVPMHGLAVGFDGVVTRDLTLGVSGGEASPQVLLNDADDRTRTRMLQVGAYGRYRRSASRIDGAIGVGGHWNNTTRAITDGLAIPVAHASIGGTSLASQIEYGYRFTIGHGIGVEPEAGFQYGRLRFDGATEDGAGVLALVVPERRVTSRRTLTGARVGKSFDGGTPLMIEGRASWAHELDPIADVHMRFAGDTWTDGFNLSAPDQLRNSAVVGVGIAGNRAKRLRFFANVDAEISGPLTNVTANVGVNKSW